LKVVKALDVADLKPEWRDKHLERSCDPMTGHCFNATNAFWHLTGGNNGPYKPMQLRHEGASHWFLVDTRDGQVVDLTASQFRTAPDYSKGVGKGMRANRGGDSIPTRAGERIIARVRDAKAGRWSFDAQVHGLSVEELKRRVLGRRGRSSGSADAPYVRRGAGLASGRSSNRAEEFAADFFKRYPKLLKFSPRRVIDAKASGGQEARQQGDDVLVFPKFWSLPLSVRDFVFAHEIGHLVQSKNAPGIKFVELAERRGIDPWNVDTLPFGQFVMDEAFADAFASKHLDGVVQRRYPAWARLVDDVESARS